MYRPSSYEPVNWPPLFTVNFVSESSNSITFTFSPEHLSCTELVYCSLQFHDFQSQSIVEMFRVQILAAVIKAGAAREHGILAEILDAVFSFIRKMEPRKVMDTMLVSRVRILYIRSLLARSPELQSIKV